MEHRRRPAATGARARALGLAALLGLTSALPAGPARAAEPDAAAGARVLAETHGGTPADWQLVHQRTTPADSLAGPMWAAKYLDGRSGEIQSVYRPAGGTVGAIGTFDAAVDRAVAALPALQRKADAPLVAAVADSPSGRTLPVAVWLDVDTEGVTSAVRAAHPEVRWLAGRPVPETIEQARQLRAELWEARRAAIAAAAESFRIEIESLGGSVAYVSTSAPLAFVDLPASSVTALAERASVQSLGLEQEWREHMSSAGPTVGANWTDGAGDQGNGVRVAVVEYHNAQTTGDLAGQVVASHSTTGRVVTGIHPTWVAGAIASRNGTWTGVAPGADIVTAGTGGYAASLSTDRAIIAAADWAVAPSGGDADIVNASIGQDTATGAEEARRYFDSIGWEDGRLVVASSGNYSTFGNWDVVSPGTGYNVLTVGGVDDRGTGGTGDDRVWYVPGSDGAAYRDRTNAAWNAHGDYNKPNLAGPAVDVRTANGTTGSGTSISSPVVAGIAAQIVGRAPTLAAWPEATRAILMAGAHRRTPMPGGGFSADHEGVGTASALWSNRILDRGTFGGYTFGAMQRGQTIVQEVPVLKGQRIHVALAWSSHTSGSSNTGKADALMADLDLVVRQPNGQVAGSYSWDNSYEQLSVTASSAGTMRIEIRHDRFDAAEEPYGLAWALTGPFSDIDGSKFYEDILWIYGQGITVGCSETRYCPKGLVTRAQMATFLTRALGLPPSPRDYFTDDSQSKHQAAINAMAHAGITVGCGGTRFCPNGTVTRAQMASFLARAFSLPNAGRDYFTDDAGNRHEDRINALAASGITHGCTATTYCPNGSVNREQMAAFIRRAKTR
ncbi:MAG TPA: S8 family serine peptidase [Candidatus Angelobacter sp.]|nr:S8 family serine peptidase [Candidatus Angelobacter sp.]